MVQNVEKGKYEGGINKLMKTGMEDLKKLYVDREPEPGMGDEFWEPENKDYL